MSLSLYTVQNNLIKKIVIYFMIKIDFKLERIKTHRTRISIQVYKTVE